MPPLSHVRQAGVTLVEMLIGVAILGVLLAVAVPSLTNMMERRRVVAAAGEIASIFVQARAEATSLGSGKLNLHLQPVPASVGDFSCVRLSTAEAIDVCRCNRAANKVCSIGNSRLLREYLLPKDSSVTFSASGDWHPDFPYAVTFKRGSYLTDVENVRVTVTGSRTQAKLRVEYINSGRVRTCSPDGSMSGYPICSAQGGA